MGHRRCARSARRRPEASGRSSAGRAQCRPQGGHAAARPRPYGGRHGSGGQSRARAAPAAAVRFRRGRRRIRLGCPGGAGGGGTRVDSRPRRLRLGHLAAAGLSPPRAAGRDHDPERGDRRLGAGREPAGVRHDALPRDPAGDLLGRAIRAHGVCRRGRPRVRADGDAHHVALAVLRHDAERGQYGDPVLLLGWCLDRRLARPAPRSARPPGIRRVGRVGALGRRRRTDADRARAPRRGRARHLNCGRAGRCSRTAARQGHRGRTRARGGGAAHGERDDDRDAAAARRAARGRRDLHGATRARARPGLAGRCPVCRRRRRVQRSGGPA